MTPTDASTTSFLEEIPFRHRADGDGVVGELDVVPELLVPGEDRVRISVLGSVADVITGILISSRTAPYIALTVDLSVRVAKPIGLGTVPMRSRVVKLGRTLATAEAWFYDGDDIAAHAWLTFMASPRPQDTLPEITMERDRTGRRMAEPFMDALGFVDAAPGVVEVERRPYTLQPAGTLQGGVVCAIVERAAETLTSRRVEEIDVRYLSTVRIGPGRADAELFSDDVARVDVVDAGRDDGRVASTGFVRFGSR
jgi:acyl-coenzyme A thioesterase PaaI-like protein